MSVLVVIAPVTRHGEPCALSLHCHLDRAGERVAHSDNPRVRVAQILGVLAELRREAAERGFTTA